MAVAPQPWPLLGPSRPRRSATWLLLTTVLAAGCGDCSSPLQVQGAHPHVRCLVAEPPAPRDWKLGELRLQQKGRELVIDGLPDPFLVAAFAGPGPGDLPPANVIAAMGEQKVQLAVMLGGVGDCPEVAAATVAALSAAPFPTLVLPGGRDEPGVLQAAVDARDGAADRVLPIAPLRAVRVGSTTLVPVAGAPDGAYARTAGACGFSLADLQAASGELGHPGPNERRFLLAWHAPGRGGPHAVARDRQGVDLGDDGLAEFAARIGAPGGLFAWPRVRPLGVASADGLQPPEADAVLPGGRLIVPRLTPPAADLADGGLQPPGFASVQLGQAGLALRAFVPTPPAVPSAAPDAGPPQAD